MKVRITQHLVTTSIGVIIAMVGVVLLSIHQITVADFVTLTPFIGLCLLAKDDFLKQ